MTRVEAFTSSFGPEIERVRPDRKKALESILNCLTGEEAVVSSTGLISREIYNLNDSKEHFYMTGSLGLASSIGLGLAMGKPEKKIVVIEGDAALLMNFGSLATIGNFAPKNLLHIVIDNEAYGSCSEESSFSSTVNLNEAAEVAGYKAVRWVYNTSDLEDAITELLAEEGPTFLLVKIELGGRRDLPRPLDLPGVRERFVNYLNENEPME